MKIEKNSNSTGFVITNSAGNSIELSFGEFWEICRTGREIDTKSEVEDYMSQCPDICGYDLDRIRAFPSLIDKITDEVIDIRIGDETGDQIYDAAESCINKHISQIESEVKWFRLSDDKCISVWYAPDKYDGDQFQMHLEEVGEDGTMGPWCEVLSDESYATNDISFKALCDTLNEICFDADIEESDMEGHYNSIDWLAKEIFVSYGMDYESEIKNVKFNNAKDLFKWLASDELSKDEILNMLSEEMCAELLVKNNRSYLETHGDKLHYLYNGETVGSFSAPDMIDAFEKPSLAEKILSANSVENRNKSLEGDFVKTNKPIR